VTADEHPRAKTTIESLAKLPSVFKKDGRVTAGNASGICDGAAANVIASEAALKDQNLKPLARIISYGVSACEPSIMGIGPVEAIRMAMSRSGGLKMQDIDMWEVNEAFAAQFLSVQKELELPNDKTNMFGGAVGEFHIALFKGRRLNLTDFFAAVGHPLGASGARIMANLAHNLHRLNKKYAVGAACIGGGQGIAIVIERV